MRASILIDGNFLDYRDKKNLPMPVISQTSNKSQEIVKELETLRQKTIEVIIIVFQIQKGRLETDTQNNDKNLSRPSTYFDSILDPLKPVL